MERNLDNSFLQNDLPNFRVTVQKLTFIKKYRESAIEVEVENDSIHFIICGNRWIPKFR